ncbi:hypothetical protein HAX54_026819 [Datura stramonium]|uniref:HECT-type E3 ubiquitin transferase n=1 Tax=Datura stramonium TaxID=4076 RepID=A0ABS8V3S9_DATST|nr:hypothetical protein [Datura stramonium]
MGDVTRHQNENLDEPKFSSFSARNLAIPIVSQGTAMEKSNRLGDSRNHVARSQLLEESFKCIGHRDPALLRGDIFTGFKHEETTGPGVLREWFFMKCRAVFNPQNPLFVSCPNDRRRHQNENLDEPKFSSFNARNLAIPIVSQGIAMEKSNRLGDSRNRVARCIIV